MKYSTPQEDFWAGDFGDGYIERNSSPEFLAKRTANLARILHSIPGGIKSALELGPNIGINFIALRRLIPGLTATGIEINEKAAKECAKIPGVTVMQDAFLNYKSDEKFDLTLTFGTLLLQNPETLPALYDILYEHSNRYILMGEYYNPTPVTVPYRGFTNRIFKRDFAGELMDRHPDVQLVDYGFLYHRDKFFPEDDINWFLMEKR